MVAIEGICVRQGLEGQAFGHGGLDRFPASSCASQKFGLSVKLTAQRLQQENFLDYAFAGSNPQYPNLVNMYILCIWTKINRFRLADDIQRIP